MKKEIRHQFIKRLTRIINSAPYGGRYPLNFILDINGIKHIDDPKVEHDFTIFASHPQPYKIRHKSHKEIAVDVPEFMRIEIFEKRRIITIDELYEFYPRRKQRKFALASINMCGNDEFKLFSNKSKIDMDDLFRKFDLKIVELL